MPKLRYIQETDDEEKLRRRMRSAPVSEGKKYEQLLVEWKHYKGAHLFGRGSGIPIWWHCQREGTDHIFNRPICRRTRAADNESAFLGCPYCAHRMSLADEGLARAFPELAKEWISEEGGSPVEVNPRSQRMAKWLCANGHVYSCMVSARTQDGQACPQCYIGDPVNLSSSPQVLRQFEQGKRNLGHDPSALPVSCKVWWQCQDNPQHSYYRCVDQLRKTGFGCPQCQRKIANTLGHYPQLAAQFHPTLNGQLRPSNLAAGSHTQVWWLCPMHPNLAWQAPVFSRCLRGDGCPYCSNKRACQENCLAIKHPHIAKEFHPTKNGNLIAETIVGSGSKVYWWLCPCGYEYSRQLCSRIRGSHCQQCGAKSAAGTDATTADAANDIDAKASDECNSELLQPGKHPTDKTCAETKELARDFDDECTTKLLQSCKPGTGETLATNEQAQALAPLPPDRGNQKLRPHDCAAYNDSSAEPGAKSKCKHDHMWRQSLLKFKRNAAVLQL